jgi:hypothetical protein
MKQKKLVLCFILLFCFLPALLTAQESICASGGNAAGTGGFVSYSIGQFVFSTYVSTYGSVTEGVQQPFEISVVTESKAANEMMPGCIIYPNPAAGFLILKTESSADLNLTYRLFHIDGKIIDIKRIVSDETIIDMTGLAPSTYLLKVMREGKELKVFKIIKNQ